MTYRKRFLAWLHAVAASLGGICAAWLRGTSERSAEQHRGDMHRADIQALLKKNSASQNEIARRTGTSRSYVCRVVGGDRRSRSVEAAIARVVGVPASRIWPSRYGRDGRSKAGRG